MNIRVNYFDRQFLKVKEFQDEQAYHVESRRRLTRRFQDWGIVHGLVVRTEDGKVRVGEGMAVDAEGCEIVLEENTDSYPLPQAEAGTPVHVWIAYKEKLDPATAGEAFGGAPPEPTRMVESAEVTVSTTEPEPGGKVVPLARFALGDPATPSSGLPGQGLDGGVRRYAGARRLAAGAIAGGAFGVYGPLTVQGAVTAQQGLTVLGGVKGDLAVTGNVSVGSDAADNPEMWNRVLEIQGGGNARFSLRSHPDPKVAIDGRVLVHDKGWWGSTPGIVVGTKSDHDLSFGVAGAVKMSLNRFDGVVVSSPFSVKGPNLATFANDVWVTGTVKTAAVAARGKITSPMWKVTQVFNNTTRVVRDAAGNVLAAGLPLEGAFESSGGMLLVFMSGSAYTSAINVTIGMRLHIDDVDRGFAGFYITNPGEHRHWPFIANALVVSNVPAGSHTVKLKPYNDHTDSNGADYFNLTVLELPF